MVKVMQLERQYNCDHLLGKFLDHDAYDVLLTEDADVYKPLGFGQVPNENSILLKFRKNVFSEKDCNDTFNGLLTGATSTDNRGLAAGSEKINSNQLLPSGEMGARKWVTLRQKAILEYFAKNSPPSLYGDMADEIYNETPNTPLEGRGGTNVLKDMMIKGGSIWIVKVANEIDFDEWFHKTKLLSPEQRKEEAIRVYKKHISNTSYGEAVLSGVGGSMDRYPRIPFCRQTGWTAQNREKFEMAFPLIEKANQIYRENLPIRWEGQRKASENLDDHFRIADTVYSTVTINKSFRTACHRDAGDLCEDGSQEVPRGFSNLCVVSNGKKFDGFYLCFPEYRVAAHIENGDFIMMDAHKIHGNTPLISSDPGFERISLVFYYRESMSECGSRAYEETRKNFVYSRRDNPEHPEWHEKWNGISPGMWESEEWAHYLSLNGFPEEAEKIVGITL